jgi:uncharacterized membrane protein YoaK (UPF0700 family)
MSLTESSDKEPVRYKPPESWVRRVCICLGFTIGAVLGDVEGWPMWIMASFIFGVWVVAFCLQADEHRQRRK